MTAYIVSFADKDIAKEFGAKWSADDKTWIAPDDTVAKMMDAQGFARMVGHIPFKIPFDDKNDAKKLGAVWHEGHWCARTNEQITELEKRWKRA